MLQLTVTSCAVAFFSTFKTLFVSDLNPVYLKTGLPTDGNQSTCINVGQYQILIKYTIGPSYVKITYKPGKLSWFY